MESRIYKTVLAVETLVIAVLLSSTGTVDLTGQFYQQNPALADSSERCNVGDYIWNTLHQENVEIFRKPSHPGMAGFEVKTNSYGLRDKEYSLEKPENTTRIVVIGDSFTYGFGLNRSERYTHILEEKMERKGYNTEVINVAVPGWGMTSYSKATKEIAVKFKPDIVVIGFWGEDEISRAFRERTKWKITNKTRTKMTSRQRKILNSAYRNFTVSSTRNNSCIVKGKEKIKRIGQSEGFSTEFYLISPIDDNIEHLEIKKHSEDLIEPPQKLKEGEKKYRLPDGHYNHLANRLLAEKLLNSLERRYFNERAKESN